MNISLQSANPIPLQGVILATWPEFYPLSATTGYFFIPLTRIILKDRLPFSFFLSMMGGRF
jgi:hypothetical protein